MSKGGKGFIAMLSTTKGGTISKIKPILTPGSIVTTPRNEVDFLVTENGIVRWQMKVLESIVVAFSMYSKIPMPHIEWNKENMKNVLCFFPWVGAVAGVLVWLWFRVS